MIPQYSHNLVTSFILWLDNQICNNAQAYINVTGQLFRVPNDSVNGIVYASPYKSWIYDSCVVGANVPSGFYDNSGHFLTRESGIVIDFINGRVISKNDIGPTISGIYSRKEINLYFSSDEENEYVLERVYGANKNINYTLTGFNQRDLMAPMIMITNARNNNEPWALGGVNNRKGTLRALTITNSNYLQEGINSFCQDLADKTFPFASYTDAPIGASGDLKTVPWSYCTGIYDRYGCNNGVFIPDVYTLKIGQNSNKNSTFLLSLMEFDIERPNL